MRLKGRASDTLKRVQVIHQAVPMDPQSKDAADALDLAKHLGDVGCAELRAVARWLYGTGPTPEVGAMDEVIGALRDDEDVARLQKSLNGAR